MDFYREFGERIRGARRLAGLSQGELALRVGLTRSVLANIEIGRQTVALHNLSAFARALGVNPMDLLPDPPTHSTADIAGTYGPKERDVVVRVLKRALRQRQREKTRAAG